MPKKVVPTPEDFAKFSGLMVKKGFRMLLGTEFKKEFVRLGLKAPRPLKGRETGFVYYANGIIVCTWTTWLIGDQTIREDDSGWVVVKQDGEKRAIYIDGPFHRTKNFFHRLFQASWLAWFRATNRPLCAKCLQRMKIKMGKAMKSRYWICLRVGLHENKAPMFLDWDHGLPEKAKAFLKKKRKTKAKRITKARAEGKEPYSAMKKRKPWIITRPENLP